MPRPKRGGRRGNVAIPSKGNRHGGLETSFTPSHGISTTQPSHNGFTLQEEARNTGRSSSVWNSDQRLRDSKVNFISAGTLDTKDSEPNNGEGVMADLTLESPETDLLVESSWSGEAWEPTPSVSPPVFNEHPSHIFVVDTHGTQPIATGLPPPNIRPPSPTPSNSSEEIILFRGKNRPPRSISKNRKNETPESPRIDGIDTRIKTIEDHIHDQKELLEEAQHHRICPQGLGAGSSQRKFQYSDSALDTIYIQEHAAKENDKGKGKGKLSRCSNRRARKQQEDEELLADYIANLAQAEKDEDEAGDAKSHYRFPFRLRELGGAEGEIYQEQPEMSSGEPIPDTIETSGWNTEWNTEDLRDFDGISTSDGESGDVENILSQRKKKSGSQYLVVYGGQSTSDARWVKASSLTNSSAVKKIAEFEAEEKLMANVMREVERMDDSDDPSEDDVDGSLNSDFDDEDLFQRKKERMSDGQIARLLAKQEELGMGSHELLLLDAEGNEEGDEAEDGCSGISQLKARSKPVKQSQSPGAKQPRLGDFAAASAFADAYDDFDPMDRDSPSLSLGLKKKRKGRKGNLPFDISDSELEASMQHAWDNDRAKKSKRKQEREELRAQGGLGSKNGKVDLKAKYKEGMSIEAVKEEIKKFLMGTNTTLPLAPMGKADRKIVHEFANAFNLKSKSVGTGNNRFPVLYRTQRTSVYAEGKFATIEARITRRFMPRLDIGGRKFGAVRPHKGGGGFGNSSASYRDGDVVGASAPELGVENRGRAMLEKMGWSTGTALGALNNKGILQPVSHVVKTTKAGLG